MILLPPHPASVMHKNRLRYKISHGIHHIGQLLFDPCVSDLSKYPDCVISVAVIMAVV